MAFNSNVSNQRKMGGIGGWVSTNVALDQGKIADWRNAFLTEAEFEEKLGESWAITGKVPDNVMVTKEQANAFSGSRYVIPTPTAPTIQVYDSDYGTTRIIVGEDNLGRETSLEELLESLL